MRKARNKKLSLLIALVFAFTVIFPVGAVFAASEPTVSYTTTTVTGGESDQSLGYIKIDNDDMSTAGEVYFELTLPDGVEFDSGYNPLDLFTPVGGEDEFAVTITKTDADEVDGVITAEVNKDFYIKFQNIVTVEKSADDDIMVKLDAKATSVYGGTAWELNSKEYKLATKATGDITATVGSPKSIKYGDQKEVAKITVKEAYSGQFDADQTITLELPSDDFAFTDVIVNGKYGLTVDTPANAGISADGESLELTINTGSTQFAGQLEITGEITVYPSAPEGDVEIDVTSSNKDFDDVSLVVAVLGDSDVTVEADEDTGMESKMRKLSINELWELTFETSGTFAQGDDIYITLPEGFEFNNDSTLGSPYGGVPSMGATGTDMFGGYVDNRGLYDSNQSIWLKVGEDADGEDEFSISGLYVAALPDAEYGDIEIEISGDVTETSVVAGNVKPAVTIEVDKASVEVGLAEVAGDIVLTETDKDALGNIIIYAELPSGVEFSSTPTVFVNDDEIDSVKVGYGDYDDDVLRIELSEMSNSRIDTITITDIEYAIDNRYSDGDELAISLGGVDVEDQINNLPYDNPESGDTDVQFKDEYNDALVKVVNAVVGDKDVVTATFTVGDEGVAIMNGRTLVQVNTLCDVLGLQKSWDAASKTAYFVKDGKVVAFPMGENAIYINGVKLPVDQGGVIINDYTYATLRGIQAAFGGELTWDAETKTATFKFEK
ncbi:MAG TPA: copper amine oxidase N-terminal domain-containing protein [Desulfotomaculum sp.]|nr:MAG: hypothetical protein JL56_04000 [Desulfotomaculum sp. BICA1-6]HBX23492.1 copper amine oxidase N-terminal domain-containing protein [Desulfotomaculum sp.]